MLFSGAKMRAHLRLKHQIKWGQYKRRLQLGRKRRHPPAVKGESLPPPAAAAQTEGTGGGKEETGKENGLAGHISGGPSEELSIQTADKGGHNKAEQRAKLSQSEQTV